MNRGRSPVPARRRVWPVAVLALALLTAAVSAAFADDAQTPAREMDKKYRIAGVVTDAFTGAPIAGVTVAGAGKSTTTNALGEYEIDSLKPGAYAVTAAKAGYVFVPPVRAVTLPPDAGGQDFSGTALVTYTVRGRITQGDGGPGLAGASVTADGRSATTAADGSYAITGLGAGTYAVVAELAGYRFGPELREVTLPPDAAGVNFSAAAERHEIWGVITVDGQPLEGVTVSTNTGRTATTNDNGRYRLTDLAPGEQTITPSMAGYSFSPPARRVTLPPDAFGQDFAATAEDVYSVAGVITRDGAPLADVTVSAGGRTDRTDNQGRYAIGGLPPGSYTITPSKGGHVFTPPSRTVTLPPSATGQDFSAASAATYSIKGRITLRESGRPLAQVEVSAGGRTTRTNDQGYFTLTGLPAGAYLLTASRDGYQFDPSSRAISVPPDATGQTFVADPAAYTISGRVVEAGDRPVAGATVSAGDRRATTDELGYYAIDGMPPGVYRVSAARAGYEFVPASRVVSLPPHAANQDFTGLAATYEVRGLVRDGQGEAMPGVIIRSDKGHSATTGVDGQYTLAGLPPGDYALTASGLGRGYFPGVRRVTVPPSVIAQNFEALEPGAQGPPALFLPVIRR